MSVSNSRIVKRMHQACANCRRKKTRCPGERPECSTCARLGQNCQYTAGSAVVQSGERNLEGRLAQLEEQMSLVLDHARSSSNVQSETPPSASARPPSRQDSTKTKSTSTVASKELPSVDLIAEMINLYFQFCHMQPLWLFDHSDLSSSEKYCEEVIFALMALTLPYSPHTRSEDRTEELSRHYSKLARDHILRQVTEGNVKLSTIQGLCMLAFANFLVGDVHFATLHIGMAMTFLRCAGMDTEPRPNDVSREYEARRRVFWSLLYLDQIYGQQSTQLNVLTNFENPKYIGSQMDLNREYGVLPPSWPQEIFANGQSQGGGIWAYHVQLSVLWRQVRIYMSQCADNNHTKPPWSADSGYSIIGAHLMDLETRLPTAHRYDTARFPVHSIEYLESNRAYWSPWLSIQFTYHAIHSLLNHPFLYSSRPQQSAQLAVPNTFWKTSSELALLHSTWIVRLVDMVNEKSYQISDPFIGHCVAVAATILIYFCRAADSNLKQAAQSKLAICKAYLGALAVRWPVCQTMHDKLEALMKSAFQSPREADQSGSFRRTVSINTSLMWEILDYTNVDTRRSRASGSVLFHESLCATSESSDEEEATVETQIFHNSTREVDTSDGGQALPPFSDRVVRRSAPPSTRLGRQEQQHGEWMLQGSASDMAPGFTGGQNMVGGPQGSLPQYAPWPGAFAGNASIMDITHDPFMQFHDSGSPYFGMWDVGNL